MGAPMTSSGGKNACGERTDRWARFLSRVLAPGAAAALIAVAGLGAFPTPAGAATTVDVVNGITNHGWAAAPRCFTGTYAEVVPVVPSDTVSFVPGPGSSPNGVGSVQLATGSTATPTGGTCASEVRNSNYSHVKLATLTSLSYWAYVSVNNGQQFPFVELSVNYGTSTPTPTAANDTMFFEPPYQTISTGSSSCPTQGATATTAWQEWTALGGCWWSNSGTYGNPGTAVQPLSDLLAAHPNAYIVNMTQGFTGIPSVVAGGLAVAVGEGSTGTQFEGNVAVMTVGTGAGTIQYNFEPPTCADLSGNMKGTDLAGGTFFGCSISGVNLMGADLAGADFVGATLHGVNLKGANLTYATFRDSTLRGVNFAGAMLTGATFTGASQRGAH